MRCNWWALGNGVPGMLAIVAAATRVAAGGGVISVPGDFPTIQAAISASSTVDGQTIAVAAGVYHETIDLLGKTLAIRSVQGPAETIIDGAGLDRSVVTMQSGEAAGTVLDGFTIENGAGTRVELEPGVFERRGGGLLVAGGAAPRITGCVFRVNSADRGGGMYSSTSEPEIVACRFVDNDAVEGGGVYAEASAAIVINSLFVGNGAVAGGGAILVRFGTGGAVRNCTVTANTAPGGFGGGVRSEASSPLVVNSILWANTDATGSGSGAQLSADGGAPTVDHTCIQGGWSGKGGAGIVTTDPLFEDVPGGDLRLDDFSPCIDAGDNGGVPAGIASDLDSHPRFVDDDGVADTGVGTPPIVDLGALERLTSSETGVATVPGDFPTIQAAIEGTAPLGVIIIQPGVYTETIDYLGKALTLESVDPEDDAIVATTIIDGAGVGPVVTFQNGEGPAARLRGLTITGGVTAASGGGILIHGAGPIIERCVIRDNDAGLGGGIACTMTALPSIVECTIESNSAGFGGGVYAELGSDPQLTDCLLTDNQASFGGALANTGASSPVIDRCSFIGNTAIGSGFGGAVYNAGLSNPTITRSMFVTNVAIDGGGVYNATSSPVFTACTFLANEAQNRGGAIFANSNSTPELYSCLLARNSARFGGGINNTNSETTAINCTIAYNTAELTGGGLQSQQMAPTLANTIVWGNTPDQIAEAFGPTTFATYCDVEGGWPGIANLDADPRFADPAADDYTLGCGSPCLDAGNNLLVPDEVTIDVAGNPRFLDVPEIPDTGVGDGVHPIVDIGGYEGSTIITGDETIFVGPGDPQGAIQAAIDSPCVGEVVIAPGVYAEPIDLRGKPIVVRSSDPDDRDVVASTIIDTNGTQPVVTCASGELRDSVLRGLTLRDGGSPTGGGVRIVNASPTIEACIIRSSFSDAGGGLYVEGGQPLIRRCLITGNDGVHGGGLYMLNADPLIVNTVINGNTADDGAGLACMGGGPALTNCVVSGNVALAGSGGGLFARDAQIVLRNTTLSRNAAAAFGGGLYETDGSASDVANTIFWGNTAAGGDETGQLGQIDFDGSSGPSVIYSLIQDDDPDDGLVPFGAAGGNLDDDPLLVDADGLDGQAGTPDDDVRLAAGSPAIDAGSSSAVPLDAGDLDDDGDLGERLPLDADDRNRFFDDTDTPDSGEPPSPIVDMGAYEFGAPACVEDIDGSGVIGFFDLVVVIATWGPCPPDEGCVGDISDDGAVGFDDLLAILATWGPCER